MGEPLLLELFVASAIPVVKILLICGIGAFCARKGLLTAEGRRVLGALSFLVFNPALIFVKLASTLTPARLLHWWPLVLNTGLSTAVGLALGYLGARLVSPPKHLRPHTVVSIALGNLGNLPLVIVSTLAASSAEVLHGIPPERAEDLAVSYVMVGLLIPCIAHATIGFSMLRKQEPAAPIGAAEASPEASAPDCCQPTEQRKMEMVPLMADPRVGMTGGTQPSLSRGDRMRAGSGIRSPEENDRVPLLGTANQEGASGSPAMALEGTEDAAVELGVAARGKPAATASTLPPLTLPPPALEFNVAMAASASLRQEAAHICTLGRCPGECRCGAAARPGPQCGQGQPQPNWRREERQQGCGQAAEHTALELPRSIADDGPPPSTVRRKASADAPDADADACASCHCTPPPGPLSRPPSLRVAGMRIDAGALARHVWKEATSPPLLAILLSVPVGCIAPLKRAFFGREGGGGGGSGAAPLALVTDCLAMLGDCTVPSILVLLGATLANGPGAARVPLRITALVNATRLALLPLLGLALVMGAYAAHAFEAPDPIYLLVLLIQNTAPTAIMVHTMASVQQNRAEEVSSILFWGYMAGILVIPFWLTLFLFVVKQNYRDTQ